MKQNSTKALTLIVVFAFTISCNKPKNWFIGRETINPITPELVVAHSDSIADAFSVAIDALGGFKKFNVKGKRVLIKPTICMPNNAQNRKSTNSQLLKRIIEQLYDEKAWEVYVLENTIDDWRKSYRYSGVEKASKLAYGKVLPAFDETEYEKHQLNDPTSYLKVHQMVSKCDLIINVAHLNIGTNEQLEAGIINLHGLTWEKGLFSNDIENKYIVSVLKVCRPALTVIDASEVLLNSGETLRLNKIIISADPVAADAMAAQIIGIDHKGIGYLNYAAENNFGKFHNKLNAVRIIEL